LIYYTEKGTKVAARPSGTEPKIKFYVSVNSGLEKVEAYEERKAETDHKIQQILNEMGV
jgi:phosphoglucomutase